MKKIMFLACMMTSMMAHAQEVDKEKVQTQAEAAVEAKKDLLKVDTGEKVWKFSGVTGLNAAATSLSYMYSFLPSADSNLLYSLR